jgi:hypothetical protein
MKEAQAAKQASLVQAAGIFANTLPPVESFPAFKKKSTGIALFEEIEINAGDAPDVTEEKEQRQALKAEKDAMIAQRNA